MNGKYEKERVKCEVAMLKQRLAYNHLPALFNSLHVPAPISLDTINNENMRQRLQDRYEKILQRTKYDMMLVYVMTEETKLTEMKVKFDADLSQMKEYQRTGASFKKLTESMIRIMGEGFKNIDERFHSLYQLKLRFFEHAPMIKN